MSGKRGKAEQSEDQRRQSKDASPPEARMGTEAYRRYVEEIPVVYRPRKRAHDYIDERSQPRLFAAEPRDPAYKVGERDHD